MNYITEMMRHQFNFLGLSYSILLILNQKKNRPIIKAVN